MWKRLYNLRVGGGSEGIERESRNSADGLAPLSRQEMSTVWIVQVVRLFARVFVRLQGARGAWASPDGS